MRLPACSSEPKRHLNRMRSKSHSPGKPVHCLAELIRKFFEVDLIAHIEDGPQVHLGCDPKQANQCATYIGQPLQICFLCAPPSVEPQT